MKDMIVLVMCNLALVLGLTILAFFAAVYTTRIVARMAMKMVLEWKKATIYNPKRDKIVVKANKDGYGFDTYVVKNAIPYPRPVLYR